MPENFYDLLGVDEDATQAELKQAYRQRAREFHPDVNADDRAGAQFKTIRRAYDVLRDEAERSAYDRLGHTSYVRKRMKGGLPSDSPANPSSSSSSSTSKRSSSSSQSSSRSSSSSSSTSKRSSSTSTSSSSRSSASTSNRTSSSTSSNRSSTATSSGSSSRTSSTTADSSASRASQSTASSSTRGRTGSTDSRRTASTADGQRGQATRTDTGSQYRRTTAGTTAAPNRRYSPNSGDGSSSSRERLRNRWVAVAAAFALYLGGLGWYGLATRATLLDLVNSLSTAPAAALTATGGFGAPAAFVRTALTTATTAPSPALLVPLGTLVLPLVLAWTVSSFGRGSAWLYVVGAFGPLVGLAVGFAVPAVPTAVYLATFLVLPLTAVLVFLGDVGRYLVATR